ncbi:MAG: MASE1 domain-containing protein [Dongiaceae bacterium]
MSSPVRAGIGIAATAAAYYLGARLGFAMRFPESPHSILWPPNAILLAALLLVPPRLWWLHILAVLPVHIAIALPGGLSWPTLLGLYATNVLQAALGAALIGHLSRRHAASGSHAEVIIFVVCGVFVSPFLLSFADAAVAIATQWSNNQYWRAWNLRFLSNAASVVIFVPPILAAAEALRAWRRPSSWRLMEAFLLALCFVLLGVIVVGQGLVLADSLPLLSFLPLLLWAAMRFGYGGASWALLGFVVVAMGSVANWTTAIGSQDGILMLQAVFLLVSIPVLYLAALHGDMRQYMQALDTTTERYSMATRAGSVGVWDWNPRTGDLFIHPELKRILGYEDHQIANKVEAWMQLYHPADGDRVLKLARAYLRGEVPAFEDEHRMRHKDGSTRWFLSRGARVRQAPGEPVRVVGTCIDITQRKKIAEELHSLEILWSAVLASLSEHIAIIDRTGVVVAVNDAWKRFGRENPGGIFARVPVGADYLGACRLAGGEAARAATGIAAVLDRSQAEFGMEYSHQGPAGTQWFEMAAVPLRRSDGGAVVSHSDVTRRKQAEADAEEQRQELAHLTRVGILGQLSGAIAHELNQPLTAILSNAQAVQRFLDREPLNRTELQAALGDIVESDQRAADVIRRLRALLMKGKAKYGPLDLSRAADDVIELVHSDLIARNVTVTCELAPGLPPVRGDRVQIQQVLLNLIMNACEAMEGTGRSDRTLKISSGFGDKQTVQICVSDNGSGIPADIQAHLFEPFVTSKPQGLGLGLSICRSIVAAHGGDLRAVDNPVGGTSFFVALPIDAESQA